MLSNPSLLSVYHWTSYVSDKCKVVPYQSVFPLGVLFKFTVHPSLLLQARLKDGICFEMKKPLWHGAMLSHSPGITPQVVDFPVIRRLT